MSEKDLEHKKVTETDLKLLFYDILNGFTKIKCNEKNGFIKHLAALDSVTTDEEYKIALEKAKNSGVPTEKEQIEYLIQEELWDAKKDSRINELKPYLSNLENTKSQLFLEADLKQIKSQIEETKKELNDLVGEREKLMGHTVEYFANKRSNESYAQKVIFKDKEFKELMFSEEEFDYFSDEELINIYSQYKLAVKNLNSDNIKRISLSYFFVNSFYLCEDSTYNYFGKPILSLTFFQIELFSYARYFKNLQQNSEIKAPKNIQNNPDELIEFYEGRKNAKEFLDKNQKGKGSKSSGGSTIVGATAKDLEKLGYKTDSGPAIDLIKEANKKGGTLNMEDFIKLHA